MNYYTTAEHTTRYNITTKKLRLVSKADLDTPLEEVSINNANAIVQLDPNDQDYFGIGPTTEDPDETINAISPSVDAAVVSGEELEIKNEETIDLTNNIGFVKYNSSTNMIDSGYTEL